MSLETPAAGPAATAREMVGRYAIPLGVLVGLIATRWSVPGAAALLLAWIAVARRETLREWTAAFRFPPTRILTTPALLLGLIITSVLLLMALFPAAFSPYDPSYQTAVLQEIDGVTMAAPFPPGKRFILGTDNERHDLLSKVIHGTGTTLALAFSIVALRLAIGCFLGWVAGWRGGEWGRNALALANASATIPNLLFAFAFVNAIGPGTGFVVFVLGLGLTGWAHWTTLLHDEIRRIRSQPYVDAAEAVGVPANLQLSRYVLPNLLPIAIATTAQEVASAMLLLAELGFLGVFFGNGQVITPRNLQEGAFFARFNDWAAMLSGTRLEVFRNWWLPVVPAGAFLIAIVGFSLLSDGLRDALDPTLRRGRPWIARVFARRPPPYAPPSPRPPAPRPPARPTGDEPLIPPLVGKP